MKRQIPIVPLYAALLLAFACSASGPGAEPEPDPGNTPSPLYYSVETTPGGTVNVYVKVEGREETYARFRVRHEVNESRNCNLWRVMESNFATLADGAMVDGARILTGGENEFVWYSARTGVTDATGGYHGNERIDKAPGCGVEFTVDGAALDVSKATGLTACRSLCYEQNSTMHQTGTGALNGQPGYQPVEGLPVECRHYKRTTFGNSGYTTANRLEWGDNNSLVKNCIYALFCVDNALATEASNESGQTAQLVMDGGSKLSSTGKRITYSNAATGLDIECKGSPALLPPNSLNTYIWDNQNYHKFYSIATFGGVTASPSKGDTWVTESSISFKYGK